MKRVIKEYFFQHDIVIMIEVLIAFIVFLNMQLFTWIAAIAIIAGIIFYTINEYVTHCFLFHLKPPKNPFF